MAKGKSAPRAGLKNVMLAKGEYLAMGVAGVVLALLLVWGASRWSGAKDPTETVKSLEGKARTVHDQIRNPQVDDNDPLIPKIDDVFKKPYRFVTAPVGAFPLTGPQFDPIAKPDTKRDRPQVLKIERYQADLVRGAMKGYDVVFDQDGTPTRIGMVVARQVGPQDRAALEKLGKNIEKRVGGKAAPVPPPPKVGDGMGGVADGGRGPGGGFDTTAQRVELGIDYVPIAELGRALTEGKKVPAAAVVPLRMIVLNAEVPYRRQVDEIRRALRLPSYQEAQRWGPIYDGYEIQRRVTRAVPGGKPDVIQDWPPDLKPNYDFEALYADLIARRKFEDGWELDYLSYFIRYDMALALPLPKLVLGSYPNLKLEGINATIEALKKSQLTPPQQSELEKQFLSRPPRNDLYRPVNPVQTGGFLAGADGGRPMGMPPAIGPVPPVGPPPKAVPVRPGDQRNQEAAPPVEIDQLLLRFVDVDVRPGYTYEYRVRLRMLNPNKGMEKDVANPAYARDEILYSPWAQIADAITVPPEAHQYAVDPAAYRSRLEKEFPAKEDKPLLDRLQARDNQVVVEQLAWLEQVRTDAGGKREPIGTWVVADVPVGRGEWVGRKQYVKLPVWSSENNKYVLREVPDKLVIGKREFSPRGWLMDFSADKSVLVDFEGGRVTTARPGRAAVTEDAAVEMLIVRPDGSLVVRSSEADERDDRNRGFRPRVVSEWEKWVQSIEKQRTDDKKGEFDRKDPKN
ncbi:MAG: hypothetical protein C0501_04045 [Isosphaera sp.]|nr:hypothetical protein [Isosphaera sp.]